MYERIEYIFFLQQCYNKRTGKGKICKTPIDSLNTKIEIFWHDNSSCDHYCLPDMTTVHLVGLEYEY